MYIINKIHNIRDSNIKHIFFRKKTYFFTYKKNIFNKNIILMLIIFINIFKYLTILTMHLFFYTITTMFSHGSITSLYEEKNELGYEIANV